MRFALVLVVCTVGCDSDSSSNPPEPPGVADAYEIDEGATLDLAIAPDAPNATVTSSDLPEHATLQGGVLTFAPDYTQAGLYPVHLAITVAGTTTDKLIVIRVHNVIHITAPAAMTIAEGGSPLVATFASTDPPGTVVVYNADVSHVPGATFDPIAGTLQFAPDWQWLDSEPADVVIDVTATGHELDSGIDRVSTAHVVYQVTEATSFSIELAPLFLAPIGGNPDPALTSIQGHNCVTCHDGSVSSPAGLDFHPSGLYAQLVDHAITADGINGSTCHSLAASGVKEVAAGDPSKSLVYMKLAGTDGGNNVGPPCGAQEPNSEPYFYLTVTDQDAWSRCGSTSCQQSLDCAPLDIACKTNARDVRKLRVWIMAGAPNN